MTRWLWTAPDGSVTDLSAWGAGNYVTADGTGGHFAPEYEFATQAFAAVGGATVQQITEQPGAPVLGLDLIASDGAELRQRLRNLAHALRPRAGIGRLTAIGDDGLERYVPCYYRKGLESGRYVVNRFRAALEFFAPSPWWRGDPVAESWSLAAPGPFFPVLPVVLSASTIAGARSIDLAGTDAPTFPLWTIRGPGSQLTLRNDTTGAELVLNASIGDGELVVIDTRPGQQSVRRATPGGATLAEQRRNLVPNPAPGSTTSWFANAGTGGGISSTRPTTGGPTGGPYWRMTYSVANTTAAGVGSGASIVVDGRAASALPIPVVAGQVYSGAIFTRTSVAQRLAAYLRWYDAAGVAVGTAPVGLAVVTVANAWTRLLVEGATAPVGATHARVDAAALTGTGAVPFPIGATFDAALAQIEATATIGGYFDGDTADDPATTLGDRVHAWTGGAGVSASTLHTVTAVGDPVLGVSLFGDLASDPAMWPLVDGVNDVSALLTNAGPASRISLAADRLYSGAL